MKAGGSSPPVSELLVADSDPQSAELSRDIAVAASLTLRTTQDSETTLDLLESGLVDVLLLSEQLPGGSDLELLRHIHYWYPETQVIMLSESPSYASAVQAIKLGAFDYLPKPLDSQVLEATIERAMEHRRTEMGRAALREPTDAETAYGIVGTTAVMWKLYKVIGKVSANIHPVLILGESGTGKELVARAIHFSGTRRERPFIPVDCGALVPTLMESELFGHERGSFTGAERSKEGLLRIAEGGTVFLDEIGELPVEVQGKLLRAVQEKEIRPVGSTKRIRIDVRVIAATNRNLEKEISEGRFRKDLYFRLNVVTIKAPPLRDRIDDIEPLVNAFLDRIARNTGQPRRKISREAVRMLKTYSWPGNVRELENFIERAVALGSRDTLEPIDFPSQLSAHMKLPQFSTSEPARRLGRVLPIAEVERHAILNAVAEAKGDKLLAARMLGIGKTTLYRKLRQYESQGSQFLLSSSSPTTTAS
ncbi:MAG TPA: sigma-54 dependent transcriptional regulator [Terriglobales bacterium]|jgi:DNA-binding NtrC family response regulator|nr:sigma-54 dependent transcriptional regulator [Terriglobales bacterium]